MTSTSHQQNESRANVLTYPVDCVDEPHALLRMEECWQKGETLCVETLNAEMVIACQKDGNLDRIVRSANLIVPDGAGVVWALRLNGIAVSRLPGIELAEGALALAAKKGAPVVLIGGKPDVIEKLKDVLPERYEGLNLAAVQDGYFKPESEAEIVSRFKSHQPKLILIALGIPKQEVFMDRWKAAFPGAVMIGVGGSFDVWAGLVNRAPAFFRKFHLEWFYRLMKQPWRFQRMAQSLPNFAFQVIVKRITGKS